jgi:tryptophanyl-tRNA synthetase
MAGIKKFRTHMSEKKVILTGIKPTGVPHIGNYFGAIEPAIQLINEQEASHFYFIADYHALNIIRDPQVLLNYTYEVAATWLACGLDPSKVMFYRQSAVPQVFELTTTLMAFTAKGLMNRAHAYKAKVADNLENQKDPDSAVNMGVYTYPILMAADILIFDTNIVPVGKDQIQHVEMAADIAQCFNHNYQCDGLVVPEYRVGENTKTVTGLDGRKMSKSYDNTIPLFLPAKKLRKAVMKIVTNSQGIEEAKDPETCNVFALYKLFATKEQQDALAERYRAGGLGWGHAKQELFEVMDAKLSPMREIYDHLMANKDIIDKALLDGEEKAREIASAKLSQIRKITGIDRT